MRVKCHQIRAKVAFTKPLTTHLMRDKGDFSCRVEQHEITFVESKSFRAENKTVGVHTCDDHIKDKPERNQDFHWKS